MAYLAERVQMTPAGCWEWQQSVDKDGYGLGKVKGKTVRVHRLSYLTTKGPIPSGFQLDHLCRNKRCCNPDHLEAVTSKENKRRAAALITHCPSGHAYEGSNLFINVDGYRVCRTCNRTSSLAWYHRSKAS